MKKAPPIMGSAFLFANSKTTFYQHQKLITIKFNNYEKFKKRITS